MSELRYLLWANDRQMWWMHDGWGYTKDRADAGRFSETDAIRYVVQSAHAGRVSEATVMVVDPPSTEEPDRKLTAVERWQTEAGFDPAGMTDHGAGEPS